MEQKPAAIVVASEDKRRENFGQTSFRLKHFVLFKFRYCCRVQVGGAVKNVLAIAAGIASGLGFGAKYSGRFIQKDLLQMTRLGVALGADKLTFSGLSGIGDLVLTCSDDLSRNGRFGMELAKNVTSDIALKNINATVEGYKAIELVLKLAQKFKVEMPICEHVFKLLKVRFLLRVLLLNCS